jgi:hypothetical protein
LRWFSPSVKILKYAEQCYAACISQTGMKIFFAFVVIRGWVIVSGGVVNAYAQTAMPEGEVQYMEIYQQMINWWFEKHGTRLTLDMVSRINMALQGHPRAGQWWEDKILQHLMDIGFRPLRHEVCLYIGKSENLEGKVNLPSVALRTRSVRRLTSLSLLGSSRTIMALRWCRIVITSTFMLAPILTRYSTIMDGPLLERTRTGSSNPYIRSLSRRYNHPRAQRILRPQKP